LDRYELTDRGKIMLTVILAVLLFFLPAAIMIISAISSQPSGIPDNEDSKASASPPTSSYESPPPVISESPPPSGGGFNPPDNSPSTDGQGPSPPGSGQSSVDPIEGTLSFFFSLNGYDNLDAVTSSMLDIFLGSPKNIPGSAIAVETPALTYEVSEVFIPFIAGAFASKGVGENRIAYIVDQSVPLADVFEVNLSYISRREK